MNEHQRNFTDYSHKNHSTSYLSCMKTDLKRWNKSHNPIKYIKLGGFLCKTNYLRKELQIKRIMQDKNTNLLIVPSRIIAVSDVARRFMNLDLRSCTKIKLEFEFFQYFPQLSSNYNTTSSLTYRCSKILNVFLKLLDHANRIASFQIDISFLGLGVNDGLKEWENVWRRAISNVLNKCISVAKNIKVAISQAITLSRQLSKRDQS